MANFLILLICFLRSTVNRIWVYEKMHSGLFTFYTACYLSLELRLTTAKRLLCCFVWYMKNKLEWSLLTYSTLKTNEDNKATASDSVWWLSSVVHVYYYTHSQTRTQTPLVPYVHWLSIRYHLCASTKYFLHRVVREQQYFDCMNRFLGNNMIPLYHIFYYCFCLEFWLNQSVCMRNFTQVFRGAWILRISIHLCSLSIFQAQYVRDLIRGASNSGKFGK